MFNSNCQIRIDNNNEPVTIFKYQYHASIDYLKRPIPAPDRSSDNLTFANTRWLYHSFHTHFNFSIRDSERVALIPDRTYDKKGA